MCGRYRLTSTPTDVAKYFNVDVRDNFPPRYNIAPTQPIAIVRQSEAKKREYALSRWGFIPSWAKKDFLDKLSSKPLINARSETVADKPTFLSAFKRRRCLVPANGFYEWKKASDGKQPYAIELPEAALFAFAGVWETATDPDGGETDTAAILTTASGADLKSLHSREPVVIAEEHFDLWLEADERDAGMLAEMLTAPPKGTWEFYPVSRTVNSPRHDGPELIEPISL